MTHVDEKNYAIVDFDILASELIKSVINKKSVFNKNEDNQVIIISPWIKDYAIPVTWPSFTSNFINITDMQTTSDILRLLLQNDVKVTIMSHSPAQLVKDGWVEWSIRDAVDFCEKIKDDGGKIVYNQKNHGKLTYTSEHALAGSGNYTNKGRNPTLQDNIGELIVKSKDEKSHGLKLRWALEKINEGYVS